MNDPALAPQTVSVGQTPQGPGATAPAPAPQAHPDTARAAAFEQQLAQLRQPAKLWQALEERMTLLQESNPEAYRYVLARLHGAAAGAIPAAAAGSEAQAGEPDAGPEADPLAAPQASALPKEVQQALGQIPQLVATVQTLQAQLASVQERHFQTDVDAQKAEATTLIGDEKAAKDAMTTVYSMLQRSPGLARTPGAVLELAKAADYEAAQKRAVEKYKIEEQVRQGRIGLMRGLGTGRSLTSEAGATRQPSQSAAESLRRAVEQVTAEVANGQLH